MDPGQATAGPEGHFNLATVIHGPLFIAFTLEVLLQGVIYVQGYLYYSRFPRDRPFLKALVAVLIFADTLNVIFNAMFLYDSLITHFGDVPNLLNTNWKFATHPILMGLTACIVQLFFSWRIKVVTGNLWVVAAVVVFSLASCVGAVACGVGNLRLERFDAYPKLQPFFIMWLAGLKHSKTGLARTDALIDRIIAVILPTGLLQAAVTVLSAGLAFGLPPPGPKSGSHFIANFVLSKLFTNSLLSSLNSRDPRGSSPTTANTSQGSRTGALRSSRRASDAIAFSDLNKTHTGSQFTQGSKLGRIPDQRVIPIGYPERESGDDSEERHVFSSA
ncbi:hypothetical protein HGRIS_010226 [Hohenbuehelia grisea]|uniref:DUF6534 domain-containing protein n=1 Tax=Hohenbuehelia grisea TaxID=104357 RepID=A0ABR3J3Z9_9AGAR